MKTIRTAPGVRLALLSALLFGCRAELPGDAPGADTLVEDVSVQLLPSTSRAWVASLRASEVALLGVAGDAAARPSWDQLVLTARNGTRQLFIDEVRDDALTRLHVYGGYIAPIEQHLVEVIYVPEGGQFLLVDARAGDRLEVDGPPVPSPDAARFITASVDLVAGHRPNRIRIYRLTNGRPVLEWETAPRDWGGAAPHWLDSGAIRLDRTIVDWSTTPLTLRSAPMRIERDGGEWRIVP